MGFGRLAETRLTLRMNWSPTRLSCCCWRCTSTKGEKWQPTIISLQWSWPQSYKKHLTGNSEQNPQRNTCSCKAHERATSFPTLYKFGDATITVHEGKANKIKMWLFSAPSTHHHLSENAKKIPETVKAYNDTKYVVDIVNQITRKYKVRTFTGKSPMHSFHNALRLMHGSFTRRS